MGRYAQCSRDSGDSKTRTTSCGSNWKPRLRVMFQSCRFWSGMRACRAQEPVARRRWHQWRFANRSKCGLIRIFITMRRGWSSAFRPIIDPNAPTGSGRTTASAARTSAAFWVGCGHLFAVAALAAVALAVPALRYLRQVPQQETRIAISLPVVEGSGHSRYLPMGGRWFMAQRVARVAPVATVGCNDDDAAASRHRGCARSILVAGWTIDSLFCARALKRLDLGSAQPQTLATVGNSPIGAWGANGDIVFNPEQVGEALCALQPPGDRQAGSLWLMRKQLRFECTSFLPDGEHSYIPHLAGNEPGTYLGAVDGSPGVRLTGEVGPGAYLPSGWFLLLRSGQDPSNSSSRRAGGTATGCSQREVDW